MERQWKAYCGAAPVAVLVAALAACGPTAEPESPDRDASETSRATSGATPVDELPVRDIEGIDVCEALPGSAVASALQATLVKAEPGPGMCSYTVRTASGSESGVQVVLSDSVGFMISRNVSENASDLPGLGVAAYTRKVTGSRQDVWVARKDGLFFHVLGFDDDVAEPVAKLALETIP